MINADELVIYIRDVCNRLISNNFSISTVIGIDEIRKFLNEERISDVLLFKQNDCISPVIFSIVFLHMNEVKKIDSDLLNRRLKPLVDEEIKIFLSKYSLPKNKSNIQISNESMSSCKNCFTRRECFNSLLNVICNNYQPSPTKIPDYWPKSMQGPY